MKWETTGGFWVEERTLLTKVCGNCSGCYVEVNLGKAAGSGSREKKEGSVVQMMVLRDSLGEEERILL